MTPCLVIVFIECVHLAPPFLLILLWLRVSVDYQLLGWNGLQSLNIDWNDFLLPRSQSTDSALLLVWTATQVIIQIIS